MGCRLAIVVHKIISRDLQCLRAYERSGVPSECGNVICIALLQFTCCNHVNESYGTDASYTFNSQMCQVIYVGRPRMMILNVYCKFSS